MPYPSMKELWGLTGELDLYSQLQHEYGAKRIDTVVARAAREVRRAVSAVRALPIDQRLAADEPSDLASIKKLRPKGPRRIWPAFDEKTFRDRVAGALLGRFAGCTLGAPIEGSPVERMENLARENGEKFPPTDYWTYVPQPYNLRYGADANENYTRGKLRGVPVDDDVTYTLLGLLILEDAGPDFTVDDVGRAWLKYLPMACTAEHIALENLKKGLPAKKAADRDNPYCEWIGADIRADPWGYLAAGWPERAAELAWRDAFLSHRRNGIYGEMYFAAAIAAAFAVNDPMEALRLGLSEIPRNCALARAVRWAFAQAPKVKNYKQARVLVDKKFAGMHCVHTINNACLTIWGMAIGGKDFTRVIGETVAMGHDNDCTAATAGSIVGAVVGKKGIPSRWWRPFKNTVRTYMTGQPVFKIDDIVARFTRQAKRVYRK